MVEQIKVCLACGVREHAYRHFFDVSCHSVLIVLIVLFNAALLLLPSLFLPNRLWLPGVFDGPFGVS